MALPVLYSYRFADVQSRAATTRHLFEDRGQFSLPCGGGGLQRRQLSSFPLHLLFGVFPSVSTLFSSRSPSPSFHLLSLSLSLSVPVSLFRSHSLVLARSLSLSLSLSLALATCVRRRPVPAACSSVELLQRARFYVRPPRTPPAQSAQSAGAGSLAHNARVSGGRVTGKFAEYYVNRDPQTQVKAL